MVGEVGVAVVVGVVGMVGIGLEEKDKSHSKKLKKVEKMYN